MLRFSIRTMMLGVVGLAVVFMIVAAGQRAHAHGKQIQCERNLRNVSLAILGYQIQTSAFPPGTWPNPDLLPEERISWMGMACPYLDLQIGTDIQGDQTWNHIGVNDLVSKSPVGVCECPESPRAAPGLPQPTTYIGIAGVGKDSPLFPKRDPRSGASSKLRSESHTLAEIKDGAATTLMIAETSQVMRGSWFQGGPATASGLDPARKPYLGPSRQFGGLHPGGSLRGDGGWLGPLDQRCSRLQYLLRQLRDDGWRAETLARKLVITRFAEKSAGGMFTLGSLA